MTIKCIQIQEVPRVLLDLTGWIERDDQQESSAGEKNGSVIL